MNTDDYQLVVQAKKGDDQAFSQIVETYQSSVYNLCYRMLNNAGDAEDAAQETFLRAYKSLKKYDPNRSFITWLLSIAAHYCIDQIRKSRSVLLPVEEIFNNKHPYRERISEEIVIQNEQQKIVQDLLDILEPKDRAVVVMYYWYNFPYKDIAKALSLTNSSVKSRLFRARKKMAIHYPIKEEVNLISERKEHGKVQSPTI